MPAPSSPLLTPRRSKQPLILAARSSKWLIQAAVAFAMFMVCLLWEEPVGIVFNT